MSGKSDSLKTIFYALGANFAIFVAKLVAALMTGSGAMMAEAVHSLADCANQGLLLIGMRNAKRAPSAEHPLGFGKAIYFWSFLVALLLFSVGGTFSFYEGMHKLENPEPLRSPWIAVGVLVFGLIAESFSMWGCMREVNKARGDTNLWRWVRQSRQSELIVVFGEDLAALVGLAIALIAVVATMLTGDPVFDAFGSIAIGALLESWIARFPWHDQVFQAAGRQERRSRRPPGNRRIRSRATRGRAGFQPDHAATRP